MARRWIVRLALLGLVAVAVWKLRASRETLTAEPFTAPVVPEPTVATWQPPVDGACPTGYPVKVNTRSGIAHEPGGRFYERTVPDRCYATAADAEADGYRRAKA